MNDSIVELSFGQMMMDLFFDLNPLVFVGLIFLILVLIYTLKNESNKNKLITSLASVLLFYYFFLLFQNIVGIPTISEIKRLLSFNDGLFNPHIYLIPLGEGISLSFILNIILFIPIGFLIPFISPKFRSLKKVTGLALIMSFLIEFSQMFTLYRATDINDLITNTLGGMIGFGFFWLLEKMSWVRAITPQYKEESYLNHYLPAIIYLLAFVTVFMT